MSGYTKLFNSIVSSTIWQEELSTRVLWITLLALCDRMGNVTASLPGLAAIARVTLEEAEKGLRILSQPDPYSRSSKFEGRRIETVEGGWLILNYAKYRRIKNDDLKRQQGRLRQARFRAKKRNAKVRNAAVTVSREVTQSNTKQIYTLESNKAVLENEAGLLDLSKNVSNTGFLVCGVTQQVTHNERNENTPEQNQKQQQNQNPHPKNKTVALPESVEDLETMQAACFVCEELSLAGHKMLWLIQDVIRIERKTSTDSAQTIAESMVRCRRSYESVHHSNFVYDTPAFFSRGIWKQSQLYGDRSNGNSAYYESVKTELARIVHGQDGPAVENPKRGTGRQD